PPLRHLDRRGPSSATAAAGERDLAVPLVTAEDNPDTLVFDTSPLVHFAREGWLGALKAVVGRRTAVIPDAVDEELQAFVVQDARLASLRDQPSLMPHAMTMEHDS